MLSEPILALSAFGIELMSISEGAVSSVPVRAVRSHARRQDRALPLALVLIPLCFLVPVDFSFYVGTFRLDAYRVGFLLFLPNIFYTFLTSGRTTLRLFDVTVLLYASWPVISLVHHLGLSQGLESGGIIALETVAAYFLARAFLTDIKTATRFVRYLTLLTVFVATIMIIEMIAGRNLVRLISSSIMGTHGDLAEIGRFGLVRARGPFAHPIHAGIIAGSLLALHWVVAKSETKRWVIGVILAVGVFASVSSGPFLMFLSQLGLLLYKKVSNLLSLPKPWYLLVAAISAFLVFLQIGSNRGAVLFLIQNLAFNAWTGFYRMLQWTYGTAEVMRQPIWGIGFGEWARPRWMMVNTSIDSFWLATALRYGLPCVLLLILTIVLIWAHASRNYRNSRSFELRNLSLGWLIVMTAWIFVGFTVHFWSHTYVFFCLLLGSGAAIAELQPSKGSQRP